jgi:quinol monooxygenase YgiN
VRAGVYLSGELLRDTHDPRRFVAIARYESEAAALAVAQDPEYAARQRRMESLCQVDPAHSELRAV